MLTLTLNLTLTLTLNPWVVTHVRVEGESDLASHALREGARLLKG